jgi:hypothetical protein
MSNQSRMRRQLPCILLKFHWHFGRTSLTRVTSRSKYFLLSASCWFLACFSLRLWRWKRYILPKHWLICSRLRWLISHKIELISLDGPILVLTELVCSIAAAIIPGSNGGTVSPPPLYMCHLQDIRSVCVCKDKGRDLKPCGLSLFSKTLQLVSWPQNVYHLLVLISCISAYIIPTFIVTRVRGLLI